MTQDFKEGRQNIIREQSCFNDESEKKQDRKIKELRKKSLTYILKETRKTEEITFYTWSDPRDQYKDSPDHQITYKVNNYTGKINVCYGKEVEAYIILDPLVIQDKGMRIYELSEKGLNDWGDKDNGNFKNFFPIGVEQLKDQQPISLQSTQNTAKPSSIKPYSAKSLIDNRLEIVGNLKPLIPKSYSPRLATEL